MKAHGWSYDAMAQKAGEAKSYVVETVGLLRLPKELLEAVARATISRSNAELLLRLPSVDKQLEMGRKIIEGGWTVRKTEAEVRKALAPVKPKSDAPISPPAAEFQIIEAAQPTPSQAEEEQDETWRDYFEFTRKNASVPSRVEILRLPLTKAIKSVSFW
jgi:ParB-like chromosome segregation protein Spo0J